jgi:hypothetical protein
MLVTPRLPRNPPFLAKYCMNSLKSERDKMRL